MTPLFAKFSRSYEFEADKYAVDHSDGNALITALKKLFKENASSLTPDPIYSNFYFSHPPAIERVEHLKSVLKS